jgi:hypothetical protein
MSEETTTQPVAVDKVALKGAAKQIQAAALVRKLGLERAMRAVATARKFEAGSLGSGDEETFTYNEVALLIQLTKVHVSADDLAVVVKAQVAEVLG